MNTGRWTILARAPSQQRRPSVPKQRTRVSVRCVCGVQRVIWLEDIAAGRSTGCESRRCAARFGASQDIRRMLSGWVERERAAVTDQLAELAEPAAFDVEAFFRERMASAEEAITEYLRAPSNVLDLERPAPTQVFCKRA